MNKNSNSFEIIFDSKSENESFARVVVAAFCTRLDPTLEEISDIKTAVSEAVTNSIVHGYEGREGKISLKCELNDNELTIEVHDDGVGIFAELPDPDECGASAWAALRMLCAARCRQYGGYF